LPDNLKKTVNYGFGFLVLVEFKNITLINIIKISFVCCEPCYTPRAVSKALYRVAQKMGPPATLANILKIP